MRYSFEVEKEIEDCKGCMLLTNYYDCTLQRNERGNIIFNRDYEVQYKNCPLKKEDAKSVLAGVTVVTDSEGFEFHNFFCPECEGEVGSGSDKSGDAIIEYDWLVNFCPNCGAKIRVK